MSALNKITTITPRRKITNDHYVKLSRSRISIIAICTYTDRNARNNSNNNWYHDNGIHKFSMGCTHEYVTHK